MNYGIGTVLAISFASTVYHTQFDLYQHAIHKVQEIDSIQQSALLEAEKLTGEHLR